MAVVALAEQTSSECLSLLCSASLRHTAKASASNFLLAFSISRPLNPLSAPYSLLVSSNFVSKIFFFFLIIFCANYRSLLCKVCRCHSEKFSGSIESDPDQDFASQNIEVLLIIVLLLLFIIIIFPLLI